jgi:hypothetical protein
MTLGDNSNSDLMTGDKVIHYELCSCMYLSLLGVLLQHLNIILYNDFNTGDKVIHCELSYVSIYSIICGNGFVN